MAAPGRAGELIARNRELGVLLDALDGVASGARAVVLEGEAGIGKTALLRRALAEATDRGHHVLACAPVGSEMRLSFAALADLLDDAIDRVGTTLPSPQRRALEVALLRAEGTAKEADRRALGLGVLGVLRTLAASAPVVLAIDDLQWLDAASAGPLAFALRRLRAEPVAVLATRRPEPGATWPFELDRMLAEENVTRLRLGPLTLGAVHEVLLAKLGLELGRPTLVRLHEATGGNPFYALEVARELTARGVELAPDQPLPVPPNVRELVHGRLQRLRPRTRRLVLAAAALARPTPATLARVSTGVEAALSEAIAAGVIEPVSAGANEPTARVRFTHPLLASISYEDTPAVTRRRLHQCLAEVVDDVEERARHLALAAEGPDRHVADTLDHAAAAAAGRGALANAAELCDLGARVSEAGPGRAERVLAAAEYHHRAGALALAAARAEEAREHGGEGDVRVRALALLGTIRGDLEGTAAAVALYRAALREPGAPRALRADVHHKLAWIHLVAADARAAARHAAAALRLAAGVDQAAEAGAAATAALTAAARGGPVRDDLLHRARELSPAGDAIRSWTWSETTPAALEGVVLLWAGELERARSPLQRMHQTALERDDPWMLMHALAYLSPVETGLGRPAEGLELARRYLELAVEAAQDAQRAGALWPVATAAAWLGLIDEARAAAAEGVALAERTGHVLYVIGNLTALGTLELSAGDPEAASAALVRAWELASAGDVVSLGRFPLRASAVEALAATGELERARAVAAELENVSEALERPWARALSARCAGLVSAASGDLAAACSECERALREHREQDRPLERARTLLVYGAALRRAQRKADARAALDSAVAVFERAGASLWAQRAAGELARIGGRSAAGEGELSATEAAITELVAAGRSNRDVAGALHLSVRTVEWNLSKIYRKLGVRSRTELAATGRKPRDSTG